MMLWRSSLRYLWQHPWQLGLSILGVALGVAVVVAIDLANSSAQRAFELSAESLSGPATHHIVGGSNELPESLYKTLRLRLGVHASMPVVETYARPNGFPAVTLQIVGNDVFAAAPFNSAQLPIQDGNDYGQLLTRPDTGLMSRNTAQQLNLSVGDSFQLRIDGKQHMLQLIGLLEPGDELAQQSLDDVVITDIATAQELSGKLGRLSRIDLIIDADASGQQILRRIQAALPPAAEIIGASARADTLTQMTRAFRLNLTALSLLALLIGMFLIYNTITFSVIQRRRLLGMLRALGVTRAEVFRLVLGEALVIAVIGTGLGILLGIALGEGLLHLVTRTINDLYFVLHVSDLSISPPLLAKGVLLGMGATLLAALYPAIEATGTPPRSSMSRSISEERFMRGTPRAALIGLSITVLSIGLLLISTRNLIVSFAALFGIMAGFALLAPLLIVALVRLLQTPLAGACGLPGKMAARGITASLGRNSIAIAALTVAISATIGVGVMVDSFRYTVVHWLENSLRADIFISPHNAEDSGQAVLNPQLVQQLTSLPGIDTVSRGRRVTIDGSAGRTELFVLQVPRAGFSGFQLKQGDTETAWQAFRHGQGVLVSEPYAYHHQLGLGDSVTLRTDKGKHTFPIAGVFYDYGSSQGVVLMNRATYRQFWNDDSIGSLGIYLKPGSDINTVIDQLRGISAGQQVQIRSNRALRAAALEIFDRSFAITNVLRGLAVLIAFIGVLSALMALQLERAKEFAVLRATGLTPRELWKLVSLETGLMGLIAGLLAVPLGLALAYILIVVINRRSFGWTMQISVDPVILLSALVLAVSAALLAGCYPAFRMARTSPALALREE